MLQSFKRPGVLFSIKSNLYIFRFKKRKTQAEYDTSFIEVKILDKLG